MTDDDSNKTVKQNVGELLVAGNIGSWAEVREGLNQKLRGWSSYFSYGTVVWKLSYAMSDGYSPNSCEKCGLTPKRF